MDHFIPLTIVHHAHQPKWFNSSIRHHIKCLNTLRRRRCNKHPTAIIRTKIEESEKSLQSKISKAKISKVKIDYEANLVSSCANNSNNKIYQYNITKSSSIPQTLFHNSSLSALICLKLTPIINIFILFLYKTPGTTVFSIIHLHQIHYLK